MKQKPGGRVSFLVASISLLTACGVIQVIPPVPSSVPGLIETLANQTITADLSLKPASPTIPLETIPSSPTIPQEANPTVKRLPSRTPLPSLTPTLSPTATVPMLLEDGTLAPCNAAEFVRDVSIPDYTLMKPGQKFTKVWEFKNVGNCTWTKNYAVVLVWGNPMGTASPIPIRTEVHPGEHVEISLNMAAPYIPACWVGWWKFQDEDKKQFGIGFKFQEIFWIKIAVYIPGVGFTKKVCEER